MLNGMNPETFALSISINSLSFSVRQFLKKKKQNQKLLQKIL